MKLRKKGFTLVEIMIVVAIIGLLAAIAIPNFVRARTRAQTSTCIANLKQIEGAAQVWAIDTGASDTATLAIASLTPAYIRRWPSCGTVVYAVPGAVSSTPVCPSVASLTDHKL
ncbi:MAG: prepilin-type N-terminal cleavage/methylation domain-containing protein [Candidatus Omnitrophica bacterium]|nr:prepilin-type N-terminal cleavage/methylation domain-containing protein [Candidatus Omnitrophota bacterium]